MPDFMDIALNYVPPTRIEHVVRCSVTYCFTITETWIAIPYLDELRVSIPMCDKHIALKEER